MKGQFTISLFGATGASGNEFLNFCLKNNLKVRALVRNINNINISNPNLELIQGDFNNTASITKVVNGSDYIVCMASSLKSPINDLMYNFIKSLHAIMLQEKVFNLTYQAGALCYVPNAKKSLFVKILRGTFGKITGTELSLKDHDKVLKYINSKMTPNGLNVIVTLPGAMGLTLGESQKDLKIQNGIKFTSSKHIDVAKFTLLNFNNQDLFGKFIYIA